MCICGRTPFHASANGELSVAHVALRVPTAVQAVLDGHDTLKHDAFRRTGDGAVCIDHRAPSHRSANAPGNPPTAVQASIEEHETPCSAGSSSWFAVVWIAQLAPTRSTAPPTPRRKTSRRQCKPLSTGTTELSLVVSGAPAGPRMVWIDQSTPSHRSANRKLVPVLLSDTPLRCTQLSTRRQPPQHAVPHAGGHGGRLDHQPTPSHRSTNGAVVPAVSTKDPTAVQAVVEVHDTPLSRLSATGATGWGVRGRRPGRDRGALDRPADTIPLSANGAGTDPIVNPTAVHAVADTHERLSPLAQMGSRWWDRRCPGSTSVHHPRFCHRRYGVDQRALVKEGFTDSGAGRRRRARHIREAAVMTAGGVGRHLIDQPGTSAVAAPAKQNASDA